MVEVPDILVFDVEVYDGNAGDGLGHWEQV